MKIGSHIIGRGNPCFVIAEAGANFRISENYDENFKHALKLIDIASEGGADAVKFQIYRASKLYVKNAGFADYIGKKKSIYDIIQEMEVPYEWLHKLKKYCDKKDIMFSATPFDMQSADELEKVGMQFYKIASYSLTDFPLLKHVAKKGKPIILSTGTSSFKDIQDAVNYIKKCGNDQIILLQCTAKYPAPLNTINLNVIKTLKEKFDLPVGFSDHSREPFIAPLGAVALGAAVIEKHYTTDNNLPGPDHGFAILPDELKQMVLMIKQMKNALGSGEKKVLNEEKELFDFARHFIYSIKEIKKGEIFTINNIDTLRPGKTQHGLEPKYFEEILGKKALVDIPEQTPIKTEMIDGDLE